MLLCLVGVTNWSLYMILLLVRLAHMAVLNCEDQYKVKKSTDYPHFKNRLRSPFSFHVSASFENGPFSMNRIKVPLRIILPWGFFCCPPILPTNYAQAPSCTSCFFVLVISKKKQSRQHSNVSRFSYHWRSNHASWTMQWLSLCFLVRSNFRPSFCLTPPTILQLTIVEYWRSHSFSTWRRDPRECGTLII